MLTITPTLLKNMRDVLNTNFLPQIAHVYKPDRQVDASGIWNDDYNPVAVYYAGDYKLASYLNGDVPCRIDWTRLYRDINRFGQEAIVNEYTIYFPYDFEFYADYRIIVDNHTLEIRKIMDAQGWQSLNAALVVEVQPNA